MMLKVGELAQRSGLTVRALHHYDQLGLLVPSARSEAGYRLYTAADVARLHAVQALRALGVPLREIGGMLAGDGSDLPAILKRQLRALDNEIAQAQALRQRLVLLGDMLQRGHQPELDDWLGTLSLMNTYSRYFSPEEIQIIVGNWKTVSAEWPPLVASVRALMDQGVPATDPRVQPLAHQWMGLIHHWLGGNFDLIERWGRMYVQEPLARRAGAPGLDLMHYIEQATSLRMAAWLRHFSLDELSRFQRVSNADWAALVRDTEALMATGTPPACVAARALAGRLRGLIDQTVGHDAELMRKMATALAAEPLLSAGALMPVEVRSYLQAAAASVEVAQPPVRSVIRPARTTTA